MSEDAGRIGIERIAFFIIFHHCLGSSVFVCFFDGGATDSLPDASVETWSHHVSFVRIPRPMPPHWATLKLALVHVRNPETQFVMLFGG